MNYTHLFGNFGALLMCIEVLSTFYDVLNHLPLKISHDLLQKLCNFQNGICLKEKFQYCMHFVT